MKLCFAGDCSVRICDKKCGVTEKGKLGMCVAIHALRSLNYLLRDTVQLMRNTQKLMIKGQPNGPGGRVMKMLEDHWNVSGSVLLSFKTRDGPHCCTCSSLLCGAALLGPWGWEARGAPLGNKHTLQQSLLLCMKYLEICSLTKSGWWNCGYLPKARRYILFFHLYLPSQSYVHLPVKLKFIILCSPLMERCLAK